MWVVSVDWNRKLIVREGLIELTLGSTQCNIEILKINSSKNVKSKIKKRDQLNQTEHIASQLEWHVDGQYRRIFL